MTHITTILFFAVLLILNGQRAVRDIELNERKDHLIYTFGASGPPLWFNEAGGSTDDGIRDSDLSSFLCFWKSSSKSVCTNRERRFVDFPRLFERFSYGYLFSGVSPPFLS